MDQGIDRRLSRVVEPEEIRKQFFRMAIDEQSACDFLNGVGVWSAVEDSHQIDGPDGMLLSGHVPVGVPDMRLFGAFGHRWLNGRATIETVESLLAEQERWRDIKRSRTKLRAAFMRSPGGSATPHAKAMFALETAFGNTLQVHLEWRGKHPHAVIQPVTVRELLIALAWIDLVTGAECKVCQNSKCGIEYTQGGSKFCTWQCEHANTTRKHRKVTKMALNLLAANAHLSTRAAVNLLKDNGIERDASWVKQQRAKEAAKLVGLAAKGRSKSRLG